MGLWNLYFIAKLTLFAGDYTGFHPWQNLAFAAFLLLPMHRPALQIAHRLSALCLGIVLAYHESFLPPASRLWTQLGELSAFSPAYLLELTGRLISPAWAAGLLVMAIVLWLASRWLRVTSFVVIALLAMPLVMRSTSPASVDPLMAAGTGQCDADTTLAEAATPTQFEARTADFFRSEANRLVRFPQMSPAAGVDVVFLHICSLAWSDLRGAELAEHRLFSQFDVVFDRFNTAASYSGPAALRLLRGNCGQTAHADLYQPAPPHCYTFNALEQTGFRTQALLNHDGHFGDFAADLRRLGALNAEMQDNRGARVEMLSFDQSPIRDDYDTLARWWQQRQKLADPRVALYYNTISLHDGNRLPGARGDSVRSYPLRLRNLLDDVSGFLKLVESSGRRAVVVFVPEHGAALHGDGTQLAGLREIPNASITNAPVGVAMVGLNAGRSGVPALVQSESSYLGLMELVSRGLTVANGAAQPDFAALTADLPETPFIAENESLLVMGVGERYFTRSDDRGWLAYGGE